MMPKSWVVPFALLVVSGCHSASWSPPEPAHGEPSVSSKGASSAAPEPTAASGASPVPSATQAAALTSATPPAEPSSPTAASTEPPGNATGTKPKSSAKEAHKVPEAAPAPSDAYAGPDPCQAKTFHYPAIGSACKKGGRKAVRDIMRGVVKKAKAAGQDVQCTSCHQDTSSFLLKPNAVSDIKQWF